MNQHKIVEQANRTCLKIFGLTKTQIQNQTIHSLISQHLLPKELKQVCQAKKERTLPEVYFRTITGKEVWIQIICSQIKQLNNDQTWMVMTQDISEQVIAKKIVEDLPTRILQAHEEEKQLLSQEIHDTFSQSLAALKMDIQALAAKQKPSNFKETLQQVDNLINLSRSIAHNLRPEIIDKLGFIAAIRNLTNEMSHRIGFAIEMKTDIQHLPISPSEAVQLFRITQEALNNAIKHSRASIISVSITKRDGDIVLSIRDNGTGFDIDEINHQSLYKKSLGLKIMRERAGKIGAACTIKSTVGRGTIISIRIKRKK